MLFIVKGLRLVQKVYLNVCMESSYLLEQKTCLTDKSEDFSSTSCVIVVPKLSYFCGNFSRKI